MDEVEVVVAHSERATLRVGDVFVKVDADPARLEREVEAMRLARETASVPTAGVLWHQTSVVGLARLPGSPLGRLGRPSRAPASTWAAAGAVLRRLHDAPLPPWSTTGQAERAGRLEAECAWLVEHDVVPAEVVARNRRLAESALRPREPVFVHGDLQVDHVFVDGDTVTGILDWSEGGAGDAAFDLAVLTLGHPEHLEDVLRGYGDGVDVDAVRGWWSLRSLTAIRWLVEHGFDPSAPGCEVDVLLRQA